MVIYALDSSAVLRYLDREPGAMRVAEIIRGHLAGRHQVIISAIHWGEVALITARGHGRQTVELVLARLLSFGFEIVPATAERAVRASLIKFERDIPYADAFGVELVSDSRDHVLVTADFDLKAAERDVAIEFLPRK
ncbi:MAG TPA: PIN domain-containing protein [Terriglobales bacterium]